MRIHSFLLALLSPFLSSAQPHAVDAETAVRGVTVFTSGARVERSARVTLPAGRTEIRFRGLSKSLDVQSIQLKADAGVTLLGVQATKDVHSAVWIAGEEASIRDRITALEEAIDSDRRLLDVYRNEEQMVIKNEAIGGQSGVHTAELRQALDLHRQRLTEIYGKEQQIEKRRKAAESQVQAWRAQLAETGHRRDSTGFVVTALVESKTARSLDLRLLYNVSDAGWYPAYDVRVVDVASPLQVLMNAHVFQRSGELWKDIALTLSTGDPRSNATPSQLQPWKLGFYDPSLAWMRSRTVEAGTAAGRVTNEKGEPISFATVALKNSRQAVTTDANGFFRIQSLPANAVLVVSSVGYTSVEVKAIPGYAAITLPTDAGALQEVVVVGYSARKSDMAAAVPTITGREIGTVTTVTQYQPVAIEYSIAEAYTLEPDGKSTTIGIREMDIPAVFEYAAVPKIDPSAFLTAGIVGWQDFDLQSGEVNLYFEGTYLGKTYLDLASTADTLLLSLGKDHGVRLERKLVKEYSARRLIGSNRTDERQYEISVRNTKKVPVTIRVTDQFPVSITKDIDVDNVKAPDAQVDKDTGLATWVLTLQPGQEKKVSVSYRVRYPKDRTVVLD
ncbi:MAG: mucoidy inhibitor MuiA family protein [Flaviaesturariibacter sp.]|nr:mucoidy inhibitor MuiA family protein [Flaviaesturariibacter sp.]